MGRMLALTAAAALLSLPAPGYIAARPWPLAPSDVAAPTWPLTLGDVEAPPWPLARSGAATPPQQPALSDALNPPLRAAHGHVGLHESGAAAVGRRQQSPLAPGVGASRYAMARESLNIPRIVNGHRANIGLVVLGHSTSDQGDYPQKLALALNANPADGRNYQVFELITGGDGGFLWSQARFAPGDLQFHRVAASSPQQWCTDLAGNRWSLRRLRVDRALTGSGDPTGGACANTAPPTTSCTYYDSTGAHTATGFGNCLARMDFKLALIQDTTNRSWPIDDWNLDGAVTTADTWPAARIPDTAEPCGNGRAGVINGRIDWNCDGTLTALDASHTVYAGWLERFSLALLSHVDHVFVTQKPLEFGATCPHYPSPEQLNCHPHNTRTPTTTRPFDHFYNPLVYWEWRALQALTTKSGLDPRIHLGEITLRRMHLRSDDCYDVGITTWAIPAGVPGRPTTITADDDEWQGGREVDAENTGCMRADHIHHNAAGGWLMADVWYEGLTPYLN